MKKLFLLLLIIISAGQFAAAQQNPTMNIEGTASSIIGKLDKSIQLNEVQKPKLLTVVTNYLQQKSNLQSLQVTNEKAYKTKINSMQNGLHTRLKTILSDTQYASFLDLKPKAPDATNVLTQLYY
ncbi:hypothetical protein [Chitinophaga sp. Cy-1792]|uniref:hypothetical protein n=1 Tax=Chitinophaga sp. Cy-1792 TaxID=2608339 RepID=UPI001422D8D7|nr:hypothetical protein [Chitinophaga sp. Cy-1792]NIG53180.1 hypothetical protein [Chitinophaga sp. Cy-1792]